MKLFINAGGKGTRLQSISRDIPKPMLPICGKPVLHHLVEWAKKNNIHDIVIMSGYKAEYITNYFKDGKEFGVHITHSVEETPLESGGAIKFAQKYIDGAISGTFTLGDDIKFNEFKELLKKYILKTKGGTVYREGSRLKEMIKGKSSRPYTLPSNTFKETINLKEGHLHRYVTIVDENDKPFEVFCSALAEDYKAFVPPDAFCILLSLIMKAGIPITTIIDKFKKYVNLSHSNLPAIVVKISEKRLKENKVRIVEKDSCSVEDIKSGECKTCE